MSRDAAAVVETGRMAAPCLCELARQPRDGNDCDLLVVDEASMVEVTLMQAMLISVPLLLIALCSQQ
jgi:tRNA(Met) C34 N-acetyltransferase TmcA